MHAPTMKCIQNWEFSHCKWILSEKTDAARTAETKKIQSIVSSEPSHTRYTQELGAEAAKFWWATEEQVAAITNKFQNHGTYKKLVGDASLTLASILLTNVHLTNGNMKDPFNYIQQKLPVKLEDLPDVLKKEIGLVCKAGSEGPKASAIELPEASQAQIEEGAERPAKKARKLKSLKVPDE